jgi:hypothetical protein
MYFAVLGFAFCGEAEARLLLDGSEQARGCVAADLRPMLEAMA